MSPLSKTRQYRFDIEGEEPSSLDIEGEEPNSRHSSDAFLLDKGSASLRNLEALHRYKTCTFYLGFVCVFLAVSCFILLTQRFRSEQDLEKRCFALHSIPCKTLIRCY
jgi:hypothetical protein